ncbi:hypothetical protein LIER_17300 [Lithospermum erythrorhizon]|uniref:Endonuclease/exonuclease/phosphatase domain-containing protein n=1 Tax=Lithospermum erythrorhizon TaxID=34254 RepID=A0AAV3QAK7_LITER
MFTKIGSFLVQSCNGRSFVLSIVYGSNQKKEREVLWKSVILQNNEPGIISGDFNTIRAFSESLGGGEPDLDSMKDFNECIKHIEVVEQPHSDSQFIWYRNWKEKGLLRVLDRVLCNKKCFKSSVS